MAVCILWADGPEFYDCTERSVWFFVDRSIALEDRDNKGQDETLNSEIARRFLQLGCKAFERLGPYETALSRQVYQVIFVLDVLRSPILITHAFWSIGSPLLPKP
jgi:hypothetical protein